MRNVLVTGAAGFIGSTMLDFLSAKKYTVYGIDNFLTGKKDNIQHSSYQDFKILDLAANLTELHHLIQQWNIDTIFHFAALPNIQQSLDQTSLTHTHTLTSTVNLLEAIKNTSVNKFIFSSTSAVYGNCSVFPTHEQVEINPLTPYALQKSMCEQYIKMYTDLYAMSAVCLRYFNVFGERMTNTGAYKSVVSIFKEHKDMNLPLPITNDGEQRRDFVYVQDVVNANYLCGITDTKKFNIFNIGYGVNYAVNEIAKYFSNNIKYIGERVESKISLCDNTKARDILKWNPTINILDWINLTYTL